MNKLLGIGAALILGISTIVVWMQGNARFAQGKAVAESHSAIETAKASIAASQKLEKIINETAKIKTSDLDRELIALGIMREHEDR